MKIEINNFGPIHHFEFDLEKDLHLIYGENNVGKSYAIRCIYLFLKNLVDEIKDERIQRLRGVQQISRNHDYLNELNRKLNEKSLNNKREKINISSQVEDGARYILTQTLLPLINISFLNTFDSIKEINTQFFNNELIIKLVIGHTITIIKKDSEFIIDNVNIKQPIVTSYEENEGHKDFISKLKVFRGNKVSTKIGREVVFFVSIFQNVVMEIFYGIRKLFQIIHFLPSSRSGLYQSINNFGQIFAELSQYRHQIKSEFKIPSFSEPVSDYYLTLSQTNTSHFNEKLQKIGEQIEEEIFEGKISFDNTTKKIFFSPRNTDLTIEITQAASMISELAPLVLFLKHVLKEDSDKKTILIIEEPEAHLHPKSQVKLMEVFAELTKHNVKIIMTSHSDYMLDKVSNMLLAKELEADKVAVYHMEMTDKGSVVKKDMEANEMGVEDTNFLPISEELYEERMNAIERLNEE